MFIELKALRSDVAALSAVIAGSSRTEGWASAEKASAALEPDGIQNARHLQNVRLDGAFSEARGEVRDVGKGNVPRWQYHVPKCRTALRRYFKRLAD